jgi:hypothetical protein
MRIEPTGSSPVAPKAVSAPPRPAATAPGSAGSVTEGGSFAPSGDLAALLAAVRQTPDVRPAAIADAAAQVSSGALNTPEAAADTAHALARSGDVGSNQ